MPRGALRARHREGMRRALLDAAAELVASEGETALTMKAVAAALDCSVGAIYRYFPSKDALVAALHDEQLGNLHDSHAAGQAHLREALGRAGAAGSGSDSAAVQLLAAVQGAAWFWIDAARSWPRELALARALLASPARPATQGNRAHEAARALTEPLATALRAAAGGGALHPGDAAWRAAVTVAALTGVVAAPPSRGDAGHDGAASLADQVLACLLEAWGADRRALARSSRILAGARGEGTALAPAIG